MTARSLALVCAIVATGVTAAPDDDEIKKLPGWDQPLPSKQYSGYIHVEDGPGGQDIMMHYNFIESQGSPKSDPLTLWQQGGPGSSGFGFGYMAELGPFHLSAESMSGMTEDGVPKLWRNPYSWDALSNILILEHPPGTGFSYCAAKNGTAVPCKWNDETQAEAFLMELQGWFELFPEYAEHDFYLTGESYAGLLLPNLMHQIATKPNKINLKAAAIGNGCTGTPGQSIDQPGTCNLGGNFDEQHNVDLFYGHGMLASKDYHAINAACNFTCGPELKACHSGTRSPACQKALGAMDRIGSYNIYNIYDTCGSGNMTPSALQQTNVDALAEDSDVQTWSAHRQTLNDNLAQLLGDEEAEPEPATGGVEVGGGPPYSWKCGMGDATNTWMNSPIVRKAINVHPQSFYHAPWPYHGMDYSTYTHASIDLYPELLSKYRIVIYNGAVDACVPYNGNEDWTAAMADKLGMTEIKGEGWRPWLVEDVPAGYVTVYDNPTGPANFTFITVKDAGHMVPQYQPERALALFKRFLEGGTF